MNNQKHQKEILQHPIFLFALLILVLNDAYLKWEFGNAITGKLSDFAGMIVLPIFLYVVFPKLKRHVLVLSALFFIFWKTPLSESFIQTFNYYSFFEIHRVVDFSDLWALLVLPIAYTILHSSTLKIQLKYSWFAHYIILVFTFFTLCATTIPRYLLIPPSAVEIDKRYTLKDTNKDEVIQRFEELGFNVEYDTMIRHYQYYDTTVDNTFTPQYLYTLNGFSTGYYQDTIDIKFSLRPTVENIILYFSEVNNSRGECAKDWKRLKKWEKRYKKRIKHGIVKKLKEKD
jgi:hypothetical protein